MKGKFYIKSAFAAFEICVVFNAEMLLFLSCNATYHLLVEIAIIVMILKKMKSITRQFKRQRLLMTF